MAASKKGVKGTKSLAFKVRRSRTDFAKQSIKCKTLQSKDAMIQYFARL